MTPLQDALEAGLKFLAGLLEKLLGPVIAYYAGRKAAQKDILEKEVKDARKQNENLAAAVGESDAALADELRRRAAAKRAAGI